MIDCPACIHVAEGGRIRLTQTSAALLEGLVYLERKAMTLRRREELNAGHPVGTIERVLREYGLLLEEIHRTQAEKGWASRIELLGSNPQGTGPRASPDQTEPVG